MNETGSKEQGMIFDIQRFSVHDGPGIRTTVFLKGCTLRCFWCHNPESISLAPQLMVFAQQCIGCKACIQVCPVKAHCMEEDKKVFKRERCIQCGKCAQACYAGALELSGKRLSIKEIMAEVEKDKQFYHQSGGGVTFSGGEPLCQKAFLRGLLEESKARGLHTAVETAGNVPWKSFEAILPYTDLFLYDLKVMDASKHQEVTGADNVRCLSNLKKLLEKKAKICVRVPVITGVNDTKECMEAIRSFLSHGGHEVPVELLPFHRMGAIKYEGLGMAYEAQHVEVPSAERIKALQKIVNEEFW